MDFLIDIVKEKNISKIILQMKKEMEYYSDEHMKFMQYYDKYNKETDEKFYMIGHCCYDKNKKYQNIRIKATSKAMAVVKLQKYLVDIGSLKLEDMFEMFFLEFEGDERLTEEEQFEEYIEHEFENDTLWLDECKPIKII